MKTASAVEVFGSVRALAAALGITVQAVYAWGGQVPASREYQIQVITNGKLKARAEPRGQEAIA